MESGVEFFLTIFQDSINTELYKLSKTLLPSLFQMFASSEVYLDWFRSQSKSERRYWSSYWWLFEVSVRLMAVKTVLLTSALNKAMIFGWACFYQPCKENSKLILTWRGIFWRVWRSYLETWLSYRLNLCKDPCFQSGSSVIRYPICIFGILCLETVFNHLILTTIQTLIQNQYKSLLKRAPSKSSNQSIWDIWTNRIRAVSRAKSKLLPIKS